MKLLLDTCVFNEKTLLSHFKKRNSSKIKLYINSIIFLELGYIYFVRQKWKIFTTILKELRIKNENITKAIAERAIRASITFKDAEGGASYYFRDCLIGATAELRKMILITRNTGDFTWLPEDSCLTPDQIMKELYP